MKKTNKKLAFAALLLGAMGVAVAAQPRPPAASASKDPLAVPAGTYPLDSRHASVIARIGHHNGVSISVFRFDAISGSLDWNGAAPESSKVTINVDPKSISSPVPGFGAELGGARFLNTDAYPTASFVSTSVKQTGPATGIITGNLTLMGVTKPITINASLVGTGKGMRGEPEIGFTGTTKFKRSDFGFISMMGPIGDEVELVIDLDFAPQMPPRPATAAPAPAPVPKT